MSGSRIPTQAQTREESLQLRRGKSCPAEETQRSFSVFLFLDALPIKNYFKLKGGSKSRCQQGVEGVVNAPLSAVGDFYIV